MELLRTVSQGWNSSLPTPQASSINRRDSIGNAM